MNKIKQPPIPLPCRLCGVTSHSVIVQHGEGIGGFFITPMTDEERKERAKLLRLKRAEENPKKIREQQVRCAANWKKRNPEKVKAQRSRYYANNKDKAKASVVKWQSKNKERFANAKNEYKKRKKIEDPIYAMAERIRSRTALAFKNNGFKKQSRTEKMLGCTFKQFAKHIEKQFTDGISWDNRGDWHLDHIIPLSCATTIEGLEKLSHYTNIRPLWAADNLLKSNNLVLI